MEIVFSGLIGAFIGAIVSAVAGRLIDIKKRDERQTELLVALHAEIVASLTRVREQNTPVELEYAVNDTSPFQMPDETDFVFDSVKDDPAILPKDVIYPVIRYYKLAGQSNGLVRGLSEQAFMSQPMKAKRKYAKQITELTIDQEQAGLLALEALEKSALTRGEESLSRFRQENKIRLASDAR